METARARVTRGNGRPYLSAAGFYRKGRLHMTDETNDESGDQPDYRVLQATMEEIAAAGEAILEVLRRSDPQSEDEVIANTHLGGDWSS